MLLGGGTGARGGAVWVRREGWWLVGTGVGSEVQLLVVRGSGSCEAVASASSLVVFVMILLTPFRIDVDFALDSPELELGCGVPSGEGCATVTVADELSEAVLDVPTTLLLEGPVLVSWK